MNEEAFPIPLAHLLTDDTETNYYSPETILQ